MTNKEIIFAKFAANQSNFTKNDNLIYNYLQLNYHNVDDISIYDIVKNTFVSKSSVSRFAQKNGFKGFYDIQVLLKQAPQIDVNYDDIYGLFDDYQSLTLMIREHINAELIHVIGQQIMNSQNILILGVGSSGFIAQELNLRLSRIGFKCTVLTDAHLMQIISINFQSNSTIIALTTTGETNELILTLKKLKASNNKIILISEQPLSQANNLADFALIGPNKNQLTNSLTISNTYVQLILVDLIFHSIIKSNFNHYTSKYLNSLI